MPVCLQSSRATATCTQSVHRSCVQEAKAKAKSEAAKSKAKQTSKQLLKQDARRFTFDPKNIPKAVQTALDTEFADWDEGQKELLVVNLKNLREALTEGYKAAAQHGNRLESGFFLGYRRIYSVAHEERTAVECSQDDFEDYDVAAVTGSPQALTASMALLSQKAASPVAGNVEQADRSRCLTQFRFVYSCIASALVRATQLPIFLRVAEDMSSGSGTCIW